MDEDELIQKEIELQNGIFEHRKNALLIPNFFYKMCRTKQQKTKKQLRRIIKNNAIAKPMRNRNKTHRLFSLFIKGNLQIAFDLW